MADTKTQETSPATAPTQGAVPTLPSHAPVDATAVPPATVAEVKKETETASAPVIATEATSSTAPAAPAKEETPEPQNPLTEKFTETEWKALKDFRAQLADILVEAHKDKETKPTTYTLWGVTLDPSTPSAKASVVLMKFLRARNLHIPSAREMLVSTIRWREIFDVEKAIKEEYPKEIFGELGHVYGTDKGGRPVTYNLYGANKDLKAVFGDVDRFIRWRVMLMEKGIEKLDFETVDQMVQVHDYEGVSMSSRDANSKRAAAEATNIFQNHYPELLYKKFFVNVPSLLTWIFWLFKPLISAATLAKMTVVGSGSHAIGKELLPVIDAKQLPKRYGGDAEAF